MSFADKIQKFGRSEFVPDGWYWLLQSKDLKSGTAKPATFLDKNFVIYRGEDDVVRILDAYCPHMGAHLCDGAVEGNSIRCPFHFWKYNAQGVCTDIPAQADTKAVAKLNSYKCSEKYGLIWLWYGSPLDNEAVPVIPELQKFELDSTLGKPFTKQCHPNVMMINAIDAHHFRSVHKLIVDLEMEPRILSPRCIQFSNTTALPKKNFLLRWAARFYQKALTYELTYWWGHTGSVMVGPDFLHFYIIFALRPTTEGKAEGQTILVTKKRAGLFGLVINPILLFLSKCVGNYFAKGDTIIFSRIKFNFQTPIKADKPILKFIDHYEQLSSTGFSTHKDVKPWSPKEEMTL
ncbi:MAG: aromatic ring-hydroxylating dioxygenase subunit alpha [Bdellovibrionota bacterium]